MSENDIIQEMLLNEDDDDQLTPKQRKILQAAVEMFAEKGYASTSTSEIAKHAGVAEGTIFRHYKTKKDLLYSIAVPMITKFAAPFFAQHFVRQVFNDQYSEYDELLRRLIHNRFEFAKENIPLLKIVLQEMAFQHEMQVKYKDIFTENVLPRFREVVDHFKEKGQIEDYPTETVIRLTITTIVGFLVTRFIIMPDYPWDDEQEIERTISFIMHGLEKA
ncbi:TetR family transcriptional regulator [Pontibacillus yanchengensis]|uniref:TetR family transcriptional regulator n=1 Tax=Pontibacillus yanchengensis TaxID=462910 RepID=A0A6I4ZXQ8_9BACI|nr:TetR/AcrR family transcriptional regulator [Pontibacillus yanchengensis]MYL34878.1 TetR family transcriptional regulator [Pontibacillus yanchengensis]